MSVAREAARRILSGNVKILDAMTVARALLAVPSPSPAPPSDIREALEYYATEYCEGWCSESDGIFPDCGGCKARAALTSSPPGDGKLREALEEEGATAMDRDISELWTNPERRGTVEEAAKEMERLARGEAAHSSERSCFLKAAKVIRALSVRDAGEGK